MIFVCLFYFLPLFKKRKKGNWGNPGAFLTKWHLFPNRLASSRTGSTVAGSGTSLLLPILWVHVDIVLWACFMGPNWLNEPIIGLAEWLLGYLEGNRYHCWFPGSGVWWVISSVLWLLSDVMKLEIFLPSPGFALHFTIVITPLSPRLNSFCPVAIAYINISK